MDEFDRLLYKGSAQLPPELSELKPPCPWKKPIGQICWGLALITITLNFLGQIGRASCRERVLSVV